MKDGREALSNRNTTDVLRSHLKLPENICWLKDRFRKELIRHLEARLSPAYRARIDVDLLAEKSLDDAIKAAHENAAYTSCSQVFQALLRTVGICDQKNAIEREEGGPCDIRRETANTDDVAPVAQNDLTPDQQVAAKEQMEQVFAALLQEKDEQRNLINILGGILDQNAAEIARVLEDHPAKFKVLTQPTIRRQIEKARGTIRKILGHSPDE